MSVSIVMAYHNRRNLFIKTLESMENTVYTDDLEIIAVDDDSREDQRIEDLENKFSNLNLKVIRIESNLKWWVNPCIPNNIGFEIASGEIIIIQNPECIHVGDIISYAADNIKLNDYVAFGCYAIDRDKTNQISKIHGGNIEAIFSIIKPTNDVPLDQCPSMNRWYQHSEYSPRCLNFCTAIMKTDLIELGGFDEAYAPGISYDDTEFIRRIKRKGMRIEMVNTPMVIHQCHGYTDYSNKRLVDMNTNRYNNTDNETTWKVNNIHTKPLVDLVVRK